MFFKGGKLSCFPYQNIQVNRYTLAFFLFLGPLQTKLVEASTVIILSVCPSVGLS